MSKVILNRDEFLTEIYTPTIDTSEIDEGLLSTLFGAIKTWLKKDWNGIKCEYPELLDKLKESDKNLTGFNLVKIQNFDVCKSIRQELCDFGADYVNYRLEAYESSKNDKEKFKEWTAQYGLEYAKEKMEEEDFIKRYDIKDDTMKKSVEEHEKKLKDLCNGNPDVERWMKNLKSELVIFANNCVLATIDDDKIKEVSDDLKKQNEEQEKEIEKSIKKDNDDASKENEAKMKEIEDQRNKVFSSANVTPINSTDAKKAFTDLKSAFDNMVKSIIPQNESGEYDYDNIIEEGVSFEKQLKKFDGTFGLAKPIEVIFADDDFKKHKKKLLKKIFGEMSNVFNIIDGLKFDTLIRKNPTPTSAQAIQAMFVAASRMILYGFFGDKFESEIVDDDIIEMMARCATKKSEIGYNLPLIDTKNPDKGNVFGAVLGALVKPNSNEIGDDDAKKAFGNNVKKLSKKIENKVKKLEKEFEDSKKK